MKYIVLILWTLSLFLLMFSSFPFRVECRPTRAMGPGPPYLPGAGQFTSTVSLGLRSSGGSGGGSSGRYGSISSCPVMEGPGSLHRNPWPELYVTDITVKAWDTPLVLEGMARSRSEVRADGTYGVTFDLIRVVKGDAPLLRRRKQFRLQFLDNPTPPSGASGGQNQSTSTALVPSRSISGSSGSGSFSRSSASINHVNNYNRALGLRNSNNNGNNQRNSQSIGSTSTRTISLKSSTLHSNYVSSLHTSSQQQQQHQLQLQQQQLQQRRGFSFSNSPIMSPISSSASSSSKMRNVPPQTVQFNSNRNQNSANVNNHSNFTYSSSSLSLNGGGSSGRTKGLRIARSHSGGVGGGRRRPSNYDNGNGVLVGVGRHARHHGRVAVSQSNNIVVSNSNSGLSSSAMNSAGSKCLPPRATVKTGRKYFVFAAKVENHFVAVFSPELANKRNTKAVESVLCKGCGQAPSVMAPQKEAVLQPKERLRIRCRLTAGNPIPVLTWYKDDRLVNLTDPRFRLRTKRRQSVLVIRKAREMDTGVYKCEAKNVFGSDHATTRVSISTIQQQPHSRPSSSSSPTRQPVRPPSPKPVGTTPTTQPTVPSSVCPYDSYCLNGGTCSYYDTIREYVCQCAEGYKGQRCEMKDIPNSGSYLSYFCIFGTNNPDYPC